MLDKTIFIFIQVMNQREIEWESMLEKEINNRKDLEEVVRTLSLVDGLTDQERAQVLAGAELTVCISIIIFSLVLWILNNKIRYLLGRYCCTLKVYLHNQMHILIKQ